MEYVKVEEEIESSLEVGNVDSEIIDDMVEEIMVGE